MTSPLTDLNPFEIASELGLKPFQGKQIFRWLHARRVFDPEAMTDLSKALRERMRATCVFAQLRQERVMQSARTGAKKILFRLLDDETVESVLLRDRDRVTLCLSTQVGCALGCAFCATGQSGFVRNLRAGEIVEQALLLLEGEEIAGRTPNIVYMGMGEPFQNYEPVMRSLRLLMDPDGLGIGARKITVSTAGDIPGIERFAREDLQVRLSISLHAADDELRSRLVPLNRRYPLRRLFEAIRRYILLTGRHVSFEWVLLKGVNDSARDAHALARLIAGLNATVNLIPYNPVEGRGFASPGAAAVAAFRQILAEDGVKTTQRRERGQDIDAACGQLRAHHAGP